MQSSVKGAEKEFSCGGVVLDGGKLILVRMKNLEGVRVWTFPKGHLEPPETPRQAAVREVEEETGYRCGIKKLLTRTGYSFIKRGRRIDKKVQWYLMEKHAKTGEPDRDEILDSRWVSFDKAEKMLRYPNDFKLLEIVKRIYLKSGDKVIR
ncbi:MAG: NUDIX domain-containing protein [bacterium]